MVARTSLLCAVLGLVVLPATLAIAQPEPRASFRSGVELVSVTAVVTDRKGRLVSELTRGDFHVLDGGESRPIIDFLSNNEAAASVALLLDVSGSMSVGSKMEDARSAASQLLTHLRGQDESAVFVFDTQLRELQPFVVDQRTLPTEVGALTPYGATSLYDAIAETARRTAERSTPHRAVVVFSDWLDTHSELTGPDVSAIASSIDVPVYLVAVVSPLDHPDSPTATAEGTEGTGTLRDLARWTGGRVYFSSLPSEASLATEEIVRDLHHQYVITFEAATNAGWRLIDVQVDNRKVRTRSAYQAKN